MKKFIRKSGATLALIAVSILGTFLYMNYIEDKQAKTYVETYIQLGGSQIVNEMTETYSQIMEQYSNYKLNRDTKKKLVDRLQLLTKKLQQVESQLNTKTDSQKLDFAYLYQDAKLVSLSLSDPTKDDIVPVVVLHASEGVGEWKKQIVNMEQGD
ncbi:hypothetical protein SAMN04487866_1087 [Thermoactinomyces sp. DSM 45891]|uniref:hypothetical protein n=1 Tax=Thermoactinomyces sp. DSM 45891 TaxID=1761907 RepID=UPI000916CAA5|nr:hypothetical protein [Thermoactinomyces sp. DSM 45891]SFX44159.1 hypothetical protein SAMN04487866_1087 [Thermoactinomyces sp. DSM 45891]